ncbi:hypothetical protein Tco_0458386 [Tanacetum coccineum]
MAALWNTLAQDAKTGEYSFYWDEQWFTLNVDLLRKALEITPVDSAHPFMSPPAGEHVIIFVNELGYPEEIHFVFKMHVNNLYQSWRAILSLINLCLTSKTSSNDKPRHYVLQMLWGIVTRSNVDYAELLWEEFVQAIQTFFSHRANLSIPTKKPTPYFVPKGEKDEVFGMPIPNELIMEAIQQSPYYQQYLEMVARKTIAKEGGQKKTATKADKPKRPTPAKHLALSEQTKLVKEKTSKPTPSNKTRKGKVMKDFKEKSKVVSPKDSQLLKVKGKALPQMDKLHNHFWNFTTQSSKDDTSANVVRDTLSPTDAKIGADMEKSNNEDQAGSNLGPSHVALAGPNPKPMHEDFITTFYLKVHESLKHTTEEHVFLENPPRSSGTLSSMKNLDDAFTFSNQFIDDKPTKEEPCKANVDTEVEVMNILSIKLRYQLVTNLSSSILQKSQGIDSSRSKKQSLQYICNKLFYTPPPSTTSTSVLNLATRVSTLEKICANFKKKHKLQDKTT